jgi:adenylate kinase
LAERNLELDAVIELKVDEGILLRRIENRVREMTARGEKLRADDNPEVLKGRLAAYRAQTAPLAGYYAGKGLLRSVDGMAPIDEVTAAIGRLLARPVPVPAKPKGAKPKRSKRSKRSKPKKAKPAKARKGAKRAKKARPAAAKRRKAGRKPARRVMRKNRGGQRKSRRRRG